MEIAPGIHRIPCIFDGTRMAAVHVIVGDEALILVDTCMAYNPEREIIPYIRSLGRDPSELRYIIISHSDSDHQGGNAVMKRHAPGAVLMCHTLDKPWIESTEALVYGRYMQWDAPHGFDTPASFMEEMQRDVRSAPMDMTLEGGEWLRLSADWYVQVVHTPGHTWGHLAVYDPRSQTLIAGEAALWNAIPDQHWQPIMCPTYCYVDTYLATIDRLLGMEIDIYSPAHWPVQEGSQVGDFLRESRNYCLHVEATLLQLAQRTPFTMKQAIARLAPQLGTWPERNNGALAFPFNGNLTRLVQRGQLRQYVNADGLVEWAAR